MLAVLSPAKRLDYDQAPRALSATALRFPKQIDELITVLRSHDRQSVAAMMHLSDDLADLNYQRYHNYANDGPKAASQALQAVQAFQGDVYLGLDTKTLSDAQLEAANERVRILSGLYGLLKPSDAIQPYRLEMGTKLATEKGKNLYQFWGDDIALALKADLQGHKDPRLVNLASNEYFKAVKVKQLPAPVVTINFKEIKNGKPTTISFMAKKARGLMARLIATEQIDQADDLKGFAAADYRFDEAGSDDLNWLFTRSYRTAAQERAAA